MVRIFPTLAIIATILMLVAFGLGWTIEDAGSAAGASGVSRHLLTGVGALVFVCMVHAIILTYFMGTGRWIEETQKAYSLSDEYYAENKRIKYRTILMMTGGIVLLVLTGAFGAMADPASRSEFAGLFGFSSAQVHFGIASLAVSFNMVIHLAEFQAVSQNKTIVDSVLADVHRIRAEHGLATDDAQAKTGV